MSTDGPLRRTQAIAPFGVGSLVVNKDGVSLIVCGLDNWFKPEERDTAAANIQDEEFKIEEWRLAGRLGVRNFRLPPDYRTKFNSFVADDQKNQYLTVPVLRFPRWHVCQNLSCGKMQPLNMERRQIPYCNMVNGGECRGRMFQVPIVAICSHGHLNDFPWREWVHRSAAPGCDGQLSLNQRGTGGLAGIVIKCQKCNAERTLGEVTLRYEDGTTYLSKTLANASNPFFCTGERPWLGEDANETCNNHLLGSLRSSSNLYYADTRSSIYLPRRGANVSPSLFKLLSEDPIAETITLLKASNKLDAAALKRQQSDLLIDYAEDQVQSGLDALDGVAPSTELIEDNLDDEVAFRSAEFAVLKDGIDEEDLRSKPQDLSIFNDDIQRYFQNISLVTTLRETRALCGFSRIYTESNLTLEQKRRQLWKAQGPAAWLPAYVVRGEGLFFEFKEERLQAWETDELSRFLSGVQKNYDEVVSERHLREVRVTPRFVLVHTFAHLLIRQLIFDCGYGSASLRERLYISETPGQSMTGVLIYTAAGDSEGTMGGLVRMGRAGTLENVVSKAIETARWCSADPVCMEIGTSTGQGPDSCNMAACHNCALLPETACEQFNRFLDRALLIGTPDGKIKGYFSV